MASILHLTRRIWRNSGLRLVPRDGIESLGMVLKSHAWWLMFCLAASTPCVHLTAQSKSLYGDRPATENADFASLKTLWDLGLFSAARSHCESQIARLEPGTDSHANWYRWRIATDFNALLRDESAQAIPLEEATDFGRKLVSDYQSLENHKRRLYWIEKETLQGRLLVATFIMANHLANPADVQQRDTALSLIREILSDAERLKNEIDALLPQWSTSPRGTRDTPPIDDAQILRLELALLRCDVLLLRSEAYSDNRKEQLATAGSMNEILEDARRLLDKDWSGFVRFELAAAKTLVLQQRYEESIRAATNIASRKNVPNSVRSSVAATMAKALRLSGKYKSAERLLTVLPKALRSPETEIEELLLLLSPLIAPEAKLTEAERDDLLSRALAMRDAIEKDYGPYWRSRAEAALFSFSDFAAQSTDPANESEAAMSDKTQAGPTKRFSVATDVQQIRARQLIAAGRIDDALKELKKAEVICSDANLADAALQFAMQQAALLSTNSRRGEAIDCIINAATAYSSTDLASKSHLTGAYLIANEIRNLSIENVDQTVVSQLSDKYRSTLANQIATWPSAPETDQAMVWLEKSFDAANENRAATDAWIVAAQRTGRDDFLHIGLWRAIITHSVDVKSTESVFQSWFESTSKRIQPEPQRLKALRVVKESFQFHTDNVAEIPRAGSNTGSERLISATNRVLVKLQTDRLSKAIEPEIQEFVSASRETESNSTNPINSRLANSAKTLIAVKLGEASLRSFGTANKQTSGISAAIPPSFQNDLRTAVESNPHLSDLQKLLVLSRMSPVWSPTERTRLLGEAKKKVLSSARTAVTRFAYTYGLFYASEFDLAKRNAEILLSGSKPNSEIWLRAKVLQYFAKLNLDSSNTATKPRQNARSDIEYVLAAYELSTNWKTRLNSLLEFDQ